MECAANEQLMRSVSQKTHKKSVYFLGFFFVLLKCFESNSNIESVLFIRFTSMTCFIYKFTLL